MRNAVAVLLYAFAVGIALPGIRGADEAATVWSDPVFQKQFLGDFGILADVEPKMTAEERALLEKVYPLMSSDPDEAARQIEAGRKPDSSALLDFVLGGIDYQKDRVEEAAARYEAAVAKFPSFRRAWKMLGVSRYRLQNSDAAILAFTRMLQLGGGDAVSYGLLGDAYAARQDHLAAEAAYRNALLLDPDNAAYRVGLVRSVLKQEKYEEAAGLLRVLLEKFPERAEFWLLQANAFVNLKQPLRAAENYEVVYRMGKGTPESMNVLGDIYVNEGLPNLAAPAYARAIELDPAQPLVRPLRNIETLLARGATAEAGGLVARLRAVAGDRLGAEENRKLLKLDARIAVADGNGEQAARVLEELVSLDPLDGEALLLLGQHHQRTGDLERALVYFERAAGIEAFEGPAKARQGQVLAAQGKYDAALPLLKRAQAIKPTDQLALYLAQVERLARTAR